MAPQAEQFDREAALMLYVADEMPAAERAAFERRLATDASLAADVEALRAAQGASFGAIDHADRQTRLPAGEGVAVRRVSRAIHQWQARRLAPSGEPQRRGLPLPWWCYPTAAAAAVITAFLVWSSRQEVGPTDPVPGANEYVNTELADWMDSSLAMDLESVGGVGGGGVDAILDVPLSSSRTDDLNAIFLSPPSSEETIQ